MVEILMRNILHKAIYDLEKKHPQYSLRIWFESLGKLKLYSFYLFLLTIIILYPQTLCFWIFMVLNILYFIVQLAKTFLILTASTTFNAIGAVNIAHQSQEELPIYTILLPVYKEDKTLKKLTKAIDKLDYPKELLDVKLLIEEDDSKTLSALDQIILPEFFEIIKVPASFPRTKPKACNYGLLFAKGKYVVVYDAEDRPHPQQLKQAIAKFNLSDEKVICIQARLNFYNKQENLLTKLFSLEYSILFNYILVGLKKLNMPIPLGGTSNHFIREKLQEIGGWDAFNVTEDADLGIRLYKEGYRTELINSVTLEESPISLKSWIVQRARWIKGHFLTSVLHLQHSQKLGIKGIIGMYVSLYMPNLIYLLLPIYLILRCFVDATNTLDNLWQFNLILGIILPIGYSMFIINIEKWHKFWWACLFSTLYYWLLPIAAMRAFWQILYCPFYWDKTEHGVSVDYEE